MKKSIFAIIILFIVGLPFSSQAVQSVSSKKAIYHPGKVSKKQKKLNFFQRIILKKIKRKIDRQSRKRNKQKKNQSKRNADRSFLFGILSILAVILGFLSAISANTLSGGLWHLFIFSILTGILGIAALISGFSYLEKEKTSDEENDNSFKAWFGIIVGVIVVGGLLKVYSPW